MSVREVIEWRWEVGEGTVLLVRLKNNKKGRPHGVDPMRWNCMVKGCRGRQPLHSVIFIEKCRYICSGRLDMFAKGKQENELPSAWIGFAMNWPKVMNCTFGALMGRPSVTTDRRGRRSLQIPQAEHNKNSYKSVQTDILRSEATLNFALCILHLTDFPVKTHEKRISSGSDCRTESAWGEIK